VIKKEKKEDFRGERERSVCSEGEDTTQGVLGVLIIWNGKTLN